MDNRTIDEVRKNEDRLINEIKLLEQENQKYKETIIKLKNIIKNDDLYEASDFESRKFQKDLLNVLKEVE